MSRCQVRSLYRLSYRRYLMSTISCKRILQSISKIYSIQPSALHSCKASVLLSVCAALWRPSTRVRFARQISSLRRRSAMPEWLLPSIDRVRSSPNRSARMLCSLSMSCCLRVLLCSQTTLSLSRSVSQKQRVSMQRLTQWPRKSTSSPRSMISYSLIMAISCVTMENMVKPRRYFLVA